MNPRNHLPLFGLAWLAIALVGLAASFARGEQLVTTDDAALRAELQRLQTQDDGFRSVLDNVLLRLKALEDAPAPDPEDPTDPTDPDPPPSDDVPAFRGVNLPEYAQLVEQVNGQWNPLLIETLKQFSDLRFLDWEKINNNSSIKAWGDVPKEPNWKDCVPVKTAIELCNLTNATPYLQLHCWAAQNDEYIRAKAREIRKHLRPGGKVRIAVGNEWWNGAFAQHKELLKWSAKEKRPDLWAGTNDKYRAAWRLYAEICVNAFKVLREELGSSVICVVETKATTDAVTRWTLEWKGCGQAADELAIAPYFKSPEVVKLLEADGETKLDAAFWSLVRGDVADEMAKTEYHAGLAREYGLDLIYYEFGPHYVVKASDANARGNLGRMHLHPEMAAICKEAVEGALQRGVRKILWYQLAYTVPGKGGGNGYAWGLFDKNLSRPTPKWEGYKAARPAGSSARAGDEDAEIAGDAVQSILGGLGGGQELRLPTLEDLDRRLRRDDLAEVGGRVPLRLDVRGEGPAERIGAAGEVEAFQLRRVALDHRRSAGRVVHRGRQPRLQRVALLQGGDDRLGLLARGRGAAACRPPGRLLVPPHG